MAVHLIRSRPGTPDGDHILEDARRGQGTLCFFHGDGVGHALDPEAGRAWSEAAAERGLELIVCETALARRCKVPLVAPWRSGSLAQFWQALLDSVSLEREESPHILIRIGKSGDERYNSEILELCLAGAVLEADMAVCFSGTGLELMRGPDAASWRQFPDFELAPLYYVTHRKAALEVAAQRLSRVEAAQMAEKAHRIIDV